MQSEEIKAAVTNLKRHDQWGLRNDPSMPELLVPADFISNDDPTAIFVGKADLADTKLVRHKGPQAAILCDSMLDSSPGRSRILYQIYTRKAIRNPHIVGKIGCVDLIRQRISAQGEFVCSVPTKVSMNELANYISPNPEAQTKFLYRLNSGKNVSVLNVDRLCQELFIDMDDIAFAVPMFYTTRKLAPVRCASLWAEPWSAWVDALANGFGSDVPTYNIYFNSPKSERERHRVEIIPALGPIYDALVAYLKAPDDVTKELLRSANNELHKFGFDCWVSYRSGLRVGEPDHRSKLFLTIAKIGSVREIVALREYVRFEKIIFFDLLPKRLPYMRE
jgi:hypothetical protein